MYKRGAIYRNKYLDARRYYVRKKAIDAGLKSPFISLDLEENATKKLLANIAKDYYVSVQCIVTSLRKEKAIPSKKLDFEEENAYWITDSEVNSLDIEAARIEKARELLKEGWRVNAVEEYLDITKYLLYKLRDEVKKDTDNSTESLDDLTGKREGEIFALWKNGFSQTDIANSLNITRQTVNSDLKKYKDAYISEHSEEDWKILEDDHNEKCKNEKKNKKLNYSSNADNAKKIVRKYIEEDGSLTMSIAGIEAEAKINSKTVQKFVLLILLERNLPARALEFAIGIIGQPEIIKPALNLFATENEENDSSRAVKYLLENRGLFVKIKKKSKNTKSAVKKVRKKLSKEKMM